MVMKKYVNYNTVIETYNVEFFITTRPFYRKVEHNIVIIKIKAQEKTIKYIELSLPDDMKLNKECKTHIEKYIGGFIKNKLKENNNEKEN